MNKVEVEFLENDTAIAKVNLRLKASAEVVENLKGMLELMIEKYGECEKFTELPHKDPVEPW